MFTCDGEAWTEQAHLAASDAGVGEYFAWSVALDAASLPAGVCMNRVLTPTGTVSQRWTRG